MTTRRSPALIAVLCAVVTAPSLHAQETQPPDVYRYVEMVRSDIEAIRIAMGRFRDERPPLVVRRGSPRHVFHQAETMFDKADRLAYELGNRQTVRAPRPPRGEVRPSHVLGMAEAAHDRLVAVKQLLGINVPEVEPARDSTKTNADVFRSVILANRQLNRLLERQFAPAEVFLRVHHATLVASKLIESFPGVESVPDPALPPLERGREPEDVFLRLLRVQAWIEQIADDSDLRGLEIDESSVALESITPSDVYDVASLVLSELIFLHRRLPLAVTPRSNLERRPKTPSDVYQLVGKLEIQVAHLAELVEADPGWWLRR